MTVQKNLSEVHRRGGGRRDEEGHLVDGHRRRRWQEMGGELGGWIDIHRSAGI